MLGLVPEDRVEPTIPAGHELLDGQVREPVGHVVSVRVLPARAEGDSRVRLAGRVDRPENVERILREVLSRVLEHLLQGEGLVRRRLHDLRHFHLQPISLCPA